MFSRIKRALVESYIGAIALGYLLAQAFLHFAGIFSAPIASLIMRREYSSLMQRNGSPMQDALPELARFVVLLLLWYILLHWLYLKPVEVGADEAQAASKALS